MKPLDSFPEWITRLLRIAAAVLIGVAVTVWVTPVNTPGRNLVPVGCGSPASPKTDALSEFVCRDLVGEAKGIAVALAVAAALLLLLSETIVPRLGERRWLRGVALAAVVATPVFALSAASLAATVASTGADGTLIRCGTPLAPATDQISKLLCGQLAASEKSLAFAGMGLALLAVVGGGYIANGKRLEPETVEGASDHTIEARTDHESNSTTARPSPHDTGSLEGRS